MGLGIVREGEGLRLVEEEVGSDFRETRCGCVVVCEMILLLKCARLRSHGVELFYKRTETLWGYNGGLHVHMPL
jgi:hypothetical protein